MSLEWRKSTFSSEQGDCVELAWRKSSYSTPDSDCIEVAWPFTGAALRDSKSTAGPVLLLPTGAVTSLLGNLKRG